MRIRCVTPMAISLPLAEPLKLSDGTIATADNLLGAHRRYRWPCRLGRGSLGTDHDG